MDDKENLQLSNILKHIENFYLDNDQRTLLDWLIWAQKRFGLGTPFRHSLKQIEKETGVKRKKQEKTFTEFSGNGEKQEKSNGWLELGRTQFERRSYSTFFINYKLLHECLMQYIALGTATFEMYDEQIRQLAEDQKKAQKPETRRQQQEQKERERKVNDLIQRLNATFKERRRMYNNGDLTGEIPTMKYSESSLSFNRTQKRKLANAMNVYNQNDINYAFLAYYDKILIDKIHPKDILNLFLSKNEDGEFSVIDDNLSYFNLKYSHK